MENNIMRSSAAPMFARALAYACTPATDAIRGTRVRVTAETGLKGHVGFAGIVPGSRTWSPPI